MQRGDLARSLLSLCGRIFTDVGETVPCNLSRTSFCSADESN
jgi:hypothetical protein